MKKILLSLMLFLATLAATAAAPQVLNVVATPKKGKVVITYNLVADKECTISLMISDNNGLTFNIVPASIAGDIGAQISPGNNKEIFWYPGLDGILEDEYYVAKVIAEDDINSVFVAGGSFYNGVSQVTVSSFFINRYECTQEEFETLMGYNPAVAYGVGDDLPVHQVTWSMAVKYCNLRSMQDGLTPCYKYVDYAGDHGSNPNNWPLNWTENNITCNWEANGYRLPTEAEWEFAARGGNMTSGFLYSGSNVCGDVAWYSPNANRTMQIGGIKAPNELGIHDMSGNAWEWCWDYYGNYPAGPQINPKGANYSFTRVIRGGGINSSIEIECTVAHRGYTVGNNGSYYNGFRCVRKAP